ncbi:MAG: hypothetical protein QNJ64_07770 [Crocosphaera sp.]|nr:hypothetical protein [Crocosphaera sp.]
MTLARSEPERNILFSASINENNGVSYAYAFGKLLVLFVNLIIFVFLVGLLLVSFLTWIMITAFRCGSEFFDWIYPEDFPQDEQNQDAAIAFKTLYGLIILLFSPLAWLVDWSEKVIKRNLIPDFSFPSLTEIIIPAVSKWLGLDNEDFPCLNKEQEQETE